MTPPIWFNEHRQRIPTRPCPKCGREEPVLRLRYEHLRMNGWKPMKTMQVVNWCDHSQQFIPWPETGGYWLLVQVMGVAT